MASISLMKIAEKMKLENLTPEINLKGIKVTLPDINRPALPMAGYFEHFEATRLQVIGFVEYSYVKRMSEKEEKEMLEKLLDYPIPGIIFCRELHPDELFRQIAIEKGVPLLMTKRATSSFTAELIRWLNVKLAPCISVHGVLVDVYGEGVLITGESGIGKSEAALELIKRGHRLVTDDVVEIRKVSEETLVGTAPDITKHFIELRGIGIVDVKALFGASSVRETQNIDLVIRLEEWDKDREYDWKRNIRNIWATRLSATTFRSVPAETWQLFAKRQLSITDRKRWDTMQRRSCIQESRIPLHVSGMRTRMRMRTKAVRHIEMFGMKAIVLRTAMQLADRTKE